MKYIITLCLLLTLAGCKSPNVTAYRTVGSIVTTVHTAYAGWCDYLVTEQIKADKLPAGDRMERRAELLRLEGRVMNAYFDYQRVMRSAKEGQYAATKAGVDNSVPPELVGAASALVNLINELQKR